MMRRLPGVNYEAGLGPHSTPLMVGDLLYTVGSIGKLHALDKKTGKVVWSQDLYKDLGGKRWIVAIPAAQSPTKTQSS